jgi:hypothetical protein
MRSDEDQGRHERIVAAPPERIAALIADFDRVWPTQIASRVLWRLMGLRLGPRHSPDHVQGWKIAARSDNWLRVETASWYMTAQAVCLVEEGQVSISLSLRYDRPIAALVWALVSGPHQRAVPVMLRQAVELMTT